MLYKACEYDFEKNVKWDLYEILLTILEKNQLTTKLLTFLFGLVVVLSVAIGLCDHEVLSSSSDLPCRLDKDSFHTLAHCTYIPDDT